MSPFWLTLERNDVFYRIRAGDFRIRIVCVEQPVAVVAHAELFHIGELAEAVAERAVEMRKAAQSEESFSRAVGEFVEARFGREAQA